jgi:hypothetical protein
MAGRRRGCPRRRLQRQVQAAGDCNPLVQTRRRAVPPLGRPWHGTTYRGHNPEMDERGVRSWIQADLADFIALGRGDSDDVRCLLHHYGVHGRLLVLSRRLAAEVRRALRGLVTVGCWSGAYEISRGPPGTPRNVPHWPPRWHHAAAEGVTRQSTARSRTGGRCASRTAGRSCRPVPMAARLPGVAGRRSETRTSTAEASEPWGDASSRRSRREGRLYEVNASAM